MATAIIGTDRSGMQAPIATVTGRASCRESRFNRSEAVFLFSVSDIATCCTSLVVPWLNLGPWPISAWDSIVLSHRLLTTVPRWLAIALILRVLVAILANYPDYFPPNFHSLFLQGREATFCGAYRAAFYVHILSAPLVLCNGLILLSRRRGSWHRRLGCVQVVVLLVFVLPSSVVMSWHAYGGWPAGLSFFLLSIATASCAIVGVVQACRRQLEQHRRWMVRLVDGNSGRLPDTNRARERGPGLHGYRSQLLAFRHTERQRQQYDHGSERLHRRPEGGRPRF
jgi:uncharacterized membrane protein